MFNIFEYAMRFLQTSNFFFFFWLNTGIKRYALIMIINFSVINQRA